MATATTTMTMLVTTTMVTVVSRQYLFVHGQSTGSLLHTKRLSQVGSISLQPGLPRYLRLTP